MKLRKHWGWGLVAILHMNKIRLASVPQARSEGGIMFCRELSPPVLLLLRWPWLLGLSQSAMGQSVIAMDCNGIFYLESSWPHEDWHTLIYVCCSNHCLQCASSTHCASHDYTLALHKSWLKSWACDFMSLPTGHFGRKPKVDLPSTPQAEPAMAFVTWTPTRERS